MDEVAVESRDYGRRYARFVLRHRWAVIILLFSSTFFSFFYLDQINLRNDPDSLLPLSNQYIATNLYSERTYGMGNIMVWGIKIKEGSIYQPWFIAMVDELYDAASQLDYANPDNFIGLPSPKMRNLGISPDGNLDFKRLLPSNGLSSDPDLQQQQLDYLRSGLEKHPVMEALLTYYEDPQGNKCSLLDSSGQVTNASVAKVHKGCSAKATFIVGDFSNGLKDEPLQWFGKVQTLMDDFELRYGDRVEFLVSGEPYFLTAMLQELWDKAWLFGISLLIILLILWYEFRHWACAVWPLVGVSMTIIMTLGLMGLTEFKLTTMMVLTPVLLLAIGIGHAMQITRRFMQEMHNSNSVEKAAEEALRYTIVPAALSIGTDLHGFFAISFVDISFYKAYAYFGIFGMSTLILTTTTLIPLLMVTFPPKIKDHQDERGWESMLGKSLSTLLTGPWKWIPAALVAGIIFVSAYYAELGRGVSALLAGEAGRSDPEIARIQDEFDIMPGAEKGINYPRAAFKDYYLFGELFGETGEVSAIADIERLSEMMPGVITGNLVIRSKAGTLPACGVDARDDNWERIIGPDRCYDELDDPPQGIFNDPEVLAALSDLEDWLRNHPHIGFTASYIQFVKTINMMLNAPFGDEPMEHMNLYAIPTVTHMRDNWYAYRDLADPDYTPNPAETIPFYNGMLQASSGAGEMDAFVNTRTWDEGVIISFLTTMDPVDTHQTIVDIQNYILEHQKDPGMNKVTVGIKGGEEITVNLDGRTTTITTENNLGDRPAIGGFLGVTEATRDVAFEEWLHAPLATATTVFIMTAIMFRSLLIATILISLAFITLLSQYGLGGYMTSIQEWSANLAFHVQVALSIAMGLGIDYSVYMVSRLREEMQEHGQAWPEALRTTISSTGSAVIISVVVLLGSLIPLMNTQLANTWSVSLYIGEALILDVITAVVFLPLLIYWLKPKFIFER